MLRNAANRPTWTLTNALADTFGARGFFGDLPLAPGDPRYSLQRRTADTYQRGAQLVARRGAGRCLYCGAVEAPGRPFRTDGYCASHTLEHRQQERDHDAIRTVLRGAAEALGIKAAGKRARRLR